MIRFGAVQEEGVVADLFDVVRQVAYGDFAGFAGSRIGVQ